MVHAYETEKLMQQMENKGKSSVVSLENGRNFQAFVYCIDKGWKKAHKRVKH